MNSTYTYTKINSALAIRLGDLPKEAQEERNAINSLLQRLNAYRNKQNQWADVAQAFKQARASAKGKQFYTSLIPDLKQIAGEDYQLLDLE